MKKVEVDPMMTRVYGGTEVSFYKCDPETAVQSEWLHNQRRTYGNYKVHMEDAPVVVKDDVITCGEFWASMTDFFPLSKCFD